MSVGLKKSGSVVQKPPTDCNIATEANRIVYVIKKIILRAQLVGVLNQLIKDDGLLLKDCLDSNTHFYILQACDKYHYSVVNRIPPVASSLNESDLSIEQNFPANSTQTADDRGNEEFETESGYALSSSIRSGEGKESESERNDNSLSKAIYILEENEEVRKLAKSLSDKLSPQMKNFIKCLTEFKNKMEVRLNENAPQYKIREKYLRETYEKNVKAKKQIEKLEEELVVTKTDNNVCLIGRNILINRHQNKIEKIQQNSSEVIEKRVNESEKAMVNDWKISMIEQEMLKQEYNAASERFANLQKEHLASEKVLRAKRSKVENQVLGWIQKFDQEIGEKQAEEEEIQSLLDRELREINEIQDKLDEQEEEYDELMQEKAEYEEEMLERRLYQFVVNRSARRIQRCFRLYKARKHAKKLARKGKSKKK